MSQPIRLGMVGLGRAGWGMHVPEIKNKTDKQEIPRKRKTEQRKSGHRRAERRDESSSELCDNTGTEKA